MLAKRIIPCLDVRNGQTVKGINFINIREVGDPVELGAMYAAQGADELVFLDITASHEGRKTFVHLVKRIALHLNIPFTVGGGIGELADIENLLAAGADKVSINSAALRNPDLIDQMARNFGSQFVVAAIDAREENGAWTIYINGGRIPTGRDLFEWAREAEDRGAGEILFTSMNHDGTKDGFACTAVAALSESLSIPVIASGGAGSMEHFADVFTKGKADAGLAASIFHFHEITVPQLKEYLDKQHIPVRIMSH
jgi:imidazole glycerol-phosphate synthase subunit HisF